MKIISMLLKDKEIARISENSFESFLKNRNRFTPNLQDWYNDCFYGVKNSRTFEERFKLVSENNYFCYSKPTLKLVARNVD